MSTFRYQDLQVWQEGVGLVKGYYSLLKQFPRDEQFGLAAQGKRAIVSVVLNIAEGSSRRTDKDFSLYVNHALGSLLEADAVLRIAVELGYLAAGVYREFAPALDRHTNWWPSTKPSAAEQDREADTAMSPNNVVSSHTPSVSFPRLFCVLSASSLRPFCVP